MSGEDTRVPVTVLTGFLGSGKTTLLNRILTEEHGRRIAVIENEFGEVGIDQALVINADEEVFEMNNGCICCTVRGDLIRILGNLLKRRDRFDRILVETTGMADPGPVAQTFFVDEDVQGRFRLDGIVTIVDAQHLALHVDESKECKEQIAFADVLVLNKCDLVAEEQLAQLEGILHALNPRARVVRASFGHVPLDAVFDTGRFDMEEAQRSPGWLKELAGQHTPETDTYGVESFVWRARRPFHPERLHAVLSGEWPGVLRSKGFFWLASRMRQVVAWSSAGNLGRVERVGYFWSAVAREHWPADPASVAAILQDWDPTWGDRKQELVVIGMRVDRDALAVRFNACLLTDDEMALGPDGWRALPVDRPGHRTIAALRRSPRHASDHRVQGPDRAAGAVRRTLPPGGCHGW